MAQITLLLYENSGRPQCPRVVSMSEGACGKVFACSVVAPHRVIKKAQSRTTPGQTTRTCLDAGFSNVTALFSNGIAKF